MEKWLMRLWFGSIAAVIAVIFIPSSAGIDKATLLSYLYLVLIGLAILIQASGE